MRNNKTNHPKRCIANLSESVKLPTINISNSKTLITNDVRVKCNITKEPNPLLTFSMYLEGNLNFRAQNIRHTVIVMTRLFKFLAFFWRMGAYWYLNGALLKKWCIAPTQEFIHRFVDELWSGCGVEESSPCTMNFIQNKPNHSSVY